MVWYGMLKSGFSERKDSTTMSYSRSIFARQVIAGGMANLWIYLLLWAVNHCQVGECERIGTSTDNPGTDQPIRGFFFWGNQGRDCVEDFGATFYVVVPEPTTPTTGDAAYASISHPLGRLFEFRALSCQSFFTNQAQR